MKTSKISLFFGAVIFSLSMGGFGATGCGNIDTSSLGSDVLAVTGADMSGEQLALPDGDGGCARDKAGRVGRDELSRLESLLGLSADQVAAIQPILDATRVALEDLRAQVKAGTLSPADAKVKGKALHDDEKAQIMAVLTAEQQAKFVDMRDHHHGPFDVKKLAEVLGLSADQVTTIEGLFTAAEAKINDLHAQVEAGTLTPDAARPQIDQIRKDTKDAVAAVLTDAQRAQLEKLMPPRGPEGGPRPPR